MGEATPGPDRIVTFTGREKRAGSRRAISYFLPEWKYIAYSAVLTSLAAVAEAASLILVVSLADGLSGTDETLSPTLGPVTVDLTFNQVLFGAAGLLVLSAVVRIVANYVTIRRQSELAREWRVKLISGFLGSTYEYATTLRRGQVLETAGQQSTQGAQVLDLIAMQLNSVFTMVILAGTSFALEPIVATTLLVGGGLLLVVLRPISKKVRALSATVARYDVNLGNILDEIARVMRDIRLFGARDHYADEAGDIAFRTARTDRRRHVYSRLVPILYQTMGLLLLLTALAVASQFSGASLTAMGGAALLLLRGISYGQRVSTFQQGVAKTLPYVESVHDLMDEYEAHSASFGPQHLGEVKSIELDAVGYEYEAEGPPALTDASLRISEHGLTGLVGPSGSGKSTIAQLILRLRQPSSGKVFVNGVDSQEFDLESWRRSVAFVPQEAELIHGTVAENVGFFRDWITEDDIREAIDSVGMTEHIDTLPQGLETQIGPTARNLSGGQKQRIGIARALIGEPSLFVLDEPTSALDEESEAWVMRTIGELRKKCIVIVITHRDSTMSHCDVLVNLQAGRIVDTVRRRPA